MTLAALLAVAACGSPGDSGSAPSSSTAAGAARGGADGAPAAMFAATGPTSAGTDQLSQKFPNTDLTVQLTGYDNGVKMVRFQLVRYVPGGPNNGHYEPDPSDSATHRLPLADSPTILSADTICSNGGVTMDSKGNPTQPCTPQQLIDALTSGRSPLAKMHVDGTDHIARVAEMYQP